MVKTPHRSIMWIVFLFKVKGPLTSKIKVGSTKYSIPLTVPCLIRFEAPHAKFNSTKI